VPAKSASCVASTGAPLAFNVIIAMGLAMCRRIAQARGDTLLQRMVITSAPPTLKMKKRKKMMVKKKPLVERIQ
jgi:hypothetical protein